MPVTTRTTITRVQVTATEDEFKTALNIPAILQLSELKRDGGNIIMAFERVEVT